MLSLTQSYEEMRQTFHWEFPEAYNMAWDVCDKWVEKDPDRTALIDLTDGVRKEVSFKDLQILSNQLDLPVALTRRERNPLSPLAVRPTA